MGPYQSEIDAILKARQFMESDVKKAIEAGANFLSAVGLCTFTEFWGRMVEGIPRGASGRSFIVFFRRLGPAYGKLLDDGIDVYGEVRCGLVHSYTLDRGGMVSMSRGSCGLELGPKGYVFHVVTFFEDFLKAVDQYVEEVRADPDAQRRLKLALAGKSYLF